VSHLRTTFTTVLGVALVLGAPLVLFPTVSTPANAQAPPQKSVRGQTRNPHGPIKIPCENCHTFTSWKPIRAVPEFNHNSTAFPLRGLHEKVECKLCHTKMVFTDAGTKCADCHADIHRGQFGAKCEQCHTVKGWNVSVKAIQQHQNRFPLLGAHAAVECIACHKNAAVGQFTGLSTQCITCHVDSFQKAKVPDHQALGFPTTCEACHSFDAWQPAKFDHLRFTGFDLTGVHAKLECSACHVNGRFKGTPSNCYACHAKDYNATKNPNHIQAGFPQDCSNCHTTATWLGAKFDHNRFTKFPLTGAHVNVACSSCHINGKFAGTPTDCASCHIQQYNSATNPNHKAAGFPTVCTICHTTVAWKPASFDHNRATKFPLTGAHVTVACSSCHINGKFAGTPTTCDACHIQQYNGTTKPNHKAAGFPTDCSICHSTVSWLGATFDHSKTHFPLTGFHVSVPCASCHINNKFVGTPTNCDGCHLPQYNATTKPNHKAAGFPTDCSICHNTVAWIPASFDHNKTKFPLTGAHVNVACANCHINGVYQGTPVDCYSCHKLQYQTTTNPNHIAASFPTTCQTCHNTTTWTGATFTHSRFPIYSGKHQKGVWTTCADCHINASNYQVFSCLTCHAHNKTDMDSNHRGVSGYVYNSANCYACHPNGTHN
jgi:hypothetical protein